MTLTAAGKDFTMIWFGVFARSGALWAVEESEEIAQQTATQLGTSFSVQKVTIIAGPIEDFVERHVKLAQTKFPGWPRTKGKSQ